MPLEPIQSLTFMRGGLFAIFVCNWGINKAFTVPKFFQALISLNYSDFEPRIIFKFILYLRENIQICVNVLLPFKTKKDFIFCIDNANAHLKKQYCN